MFSQVPKAQGPAGEDRAGGAAKEEWKHNAKSLLLLGFGNAHVFWVCTLQAVSGSKEAQGVPYCPRLDLLDLLRC